MNFIKNVGTGMLGVAIIIGTIVALVQIIRLFVWLLVLMPLSCLLVFFTATVIYILYHIGKDIRKDKNRW